MVKVPTSELIQKWKPILEHEDLEAIPNLHKRNVVARLLENTHDEMNNAPGEWAMTRAGLLQEVAPTNHIGGGNIATYDPVMISLLRRAMPNLLAYDLCAVQPMTGPTGLIFAMRSRYTDQSGTETFYNEVNTQFSSVTTGANTLGQKHVGSNVTGVYDVNTYNFGSAMATLQAEALGTSGNVAFPEMAFTIEKVTVTAKSRALKAEYSMELAQDLKAIHGLDAESELANILSTEILAEINREVVRTIHAIAVPGAQNDVTTAGTFDLDTDANGRWSVEKWKGLMFQIEREANKLAQQTRRGRGNLVICSSDVASALMMTGFLSYTPALNQNNGLVPDDTGNTFVGVLNGRYKVYIDPYAGSQYMVVGYKGSNQYDAGLFYCPYVPLQMVRAIGENSFIPKIGFKTRYGMVMNPYSKGATASNGSIEANVNVYYRRVTISNLF